MHLNLEKRGSLAVHCVVNGPIQTNTYIAVSGNEAVIVDPAWDGEKLAEVLAERCPGARVAAIICTHGHADHIGGVAGLKRALGADAPFLISETDAAIMERAIADMREMWGFDHEVPPVPDRLLNEDDVVEFGDVALQVMATPGHTPGGIVLFCPATTGNVAFVGDTLFPGAHGRTDLDGGSEKQIIDSLGKMGTYLPQDTLCLVGHNDTTTIAAELEQNLFMRRGLRHYR
ncbi:MAG: MBL fold metallo-hydrolase [Coriobacteriaceae bacterium]|nr:MBL fold metallo-hydrolase [Coriobacteriaceae bacterium]